jgi:hypothetical protein
VTRTLGYLKQNAIALAALFIALGGTSYAAVAIPKNSVGSSQLRRGAVTSSKIRSGAITPGKLASNSFGGRILYLAEINPDGSLAFSYPRGTKTTTWTQGTSGILVLPHPVSRGCVPLAGAASVAAAPSSTSVASGVPAVSAQFDSRTEVQLIFNGGFPVTVEILCGR